jgi:hypothetical protein
MANRNTRSSGILNDKMLKFVAGWAGSAVGAARAAGYKNPEASSKKLMQNPVVRKLIRTRQESMAKESGKLLGRQITFCRTDVINRLWELAQLSPQKTSNAIGGQIKAAEVLAQIFDIKINRSADLDRLLQGKTEEEVNFYVIHGYFLETGEDSNGQVGPQ